MGCGLPGIDMNTIKIKLEVVHAIKGRARIKIVTGLVPSVFFVVLEAGLREIEAIKKAELNPYAESVTLYYQGAVDLASILERLKCTLADITSDPSFAERLSEIEDALALAGPERVNVFVRDRILVVSRGIDHAVKRITGNAIDMKTALPVTSLSAGLATLLLAPGLPTPTWLVLMIFGFTSFNMFKTPESHPSTPIERLDPASLDALKTQLLGALARQPEA